MSKNLKLRAALNLAAKGFRVFPLSPGTAIPPKDFAWKAEATTDPTQITAWWNGPEWNIGVATGDFTVIDLDVKNGKNGLAEGLELDLDLTTFSVRTPSGGYHFYYLDSGFSNKAGTLELPSGGKAEGVDVRGVGGYVVGPGSVTEKGEYTLDQDRPLRPLPDGWTARLNVAATKSDQRFDGDDSELSISTAVNFLTRSAPAIEGQGGDAATLSLFAMLRDYGVTQDTAYELALEHWNERCLPPWEPDDLRLKAENAFRYAQNDTPSRDPAMMLEGLEDLTAPPARAPATEESEPADRWKFMSLRGEKDRPPPEWLVKRILPKVGVACIWGPSGSGKSLVAQDLIVRIGQSGHWLGAKVAHSGGTLLLAAEAAEILAARLTAAKAPEDAPLVWADTPSFFSSDTKWEDFASIVNAGRAKLLADYGQPLRLVVIDTLSASTLVQDENDNAEMQRAVSTLTRFAKKAEVLILLVHHSEKTGKELRGASSLRGGLDSSISVNKGDGRLRTARLDKCRRAVERDLGTFVVEEDWFRDADGDSDSVPRLSWVSDIELPDIRPKHADTLIAALTVTFGRARVVDAVKEFEALSKLQRDVSGAFNDALTYLVRKGEIVEEGADLLLRKNA